MKNFWQVLTKPIFILAPMDDVTDVVFREIISQTGSPDVFFTEFTNCDALFSKGRDSQIRRLEFTPNQHPIVAQIWGLKPENYFKTAQLIQELGFDGIDINMGCPEKSVVQNGACGGLIKNPKLAAEIIEAVRSGAGELPVSVKTRIGLRSIETEEWISFLLKQNLDALIIHGRTVSEKSKVPVHWDEISKAVKLRDEMGLDTAVIGNGDIKSREDAQKKCEDYKLDGIMIGRGIFENPWLFNKNKKLEDIKIQEKVNLLITHTRLFDSTWGNTKNFLILRRFFKIYMNNFPGANNFRIKLMETINSKQVEKIINSKFIPNQQN